MQKVLLSAAIAIVTQGAYAEDYATNDFYIYPHYSYYNYDDIDNASIDNGDGFGLSLGLNMDDNWGAELSWDRISTEASNVDFDTDLYQLNAVYSFDSDGNWKPFLLAGIGHINNSVDTTPSATEDGTNADLGVGINYVINQTFGLRADLRAIHTFDYSANDLMATIGLTIGFGGSSSSDSASEKVAAVGVAAAVTITDADNDGVTDSDDQCQSTPENVAVDATGCATDSDADGVADYKDQCTGTPVGAAVDDNGCRKTLTETVAITLSLSFDNNSDAVKPEFSEKIEKVAEFMKKYPDTTVVFEGHSDSSGDATYNKQLSQKRAQAVADSLINDYNIDASRVSAVGYGEEKPIADNSTLAGRKANRRVVAQINAMVTKPE